MKLPKLEHNGDTINEYIDFLELKGKKERTIENRVWGVVPFLSYIAEKELKSVTQKDIEKFILHLKKGGKAPSSVHMYMFNTRYFFKWFLPNNDFFENVELKRPKIDHSKKEYVNIEDVKKLLQVCRHQRDRAFIFVMWESAGRLEEILQLNVEDVEPEKKGITVHLRGKTGVRDVLIIDAVPDLLNWLNLYKGEKGQPLFPTTAGKRLSHTGAQSLIERVAKRAKITEKHVFCHSFRHGRLTELAKLNVPEMELRLFAGWGSDSDMPSVYIHPKKKDLYSRLLKAKGILPEEEEINAMETTSKICPACGIENSFDAVACYKCRAIIDPKIAMEIANEENKKRQEIEQLKKEVSELKKVQEDSKLFSSVLKVLTDSGKLEELTQIIKTK